MSLTSGKPRGRAEAGGTDPVIEFAEVFKEHSPFVWRVLLRLGVRRSDVEDVAQEVFIVLHRKLPEFEGRSSLRSFIYGVCVRKASDYRRSARIRREQIDEDIIEKASLPPSQLNEADKKRARRVLDELLKDLDDKKLPVFVLAEIEGLPMREVAEAVGCTIPTAYARLAAARRTLSAAIRRRAFVHASNRGDSDVVALSRQASS